MTEMSTGAPHRNKARGSEFKGEVADFLRSAGHSEAKPETPVTIGEELRSPGDIGGIPFVLAVRTSQRHDISTQLDQASNTAFFLGRRWFGAVLSRRGRPIGESYVVVDLATFADLMQYLPADVPDED
ncbi:hypothetical protein [Nocardioides bizhenqiangii]|uniref:Uncharacterized protein n=1 Tax=Nocardioides bizhenqiangii TaxID=3095076 RepID=A0ABZ0ZR47_9ACTN|nr:hypothetical protein [Nocardioides sp. HM61]WQQ26818.1 hypothetical protein SHK19_00965 [Nocardioides sp. HM61]